MSMIHRYIRVPILDLRLQTCSCVRMRTGASSAPQREAEAFPSTGKPGKRAPRSVDDFRLDFAECKDLQLQPVPY